MSETNNIHKYPGFTNIKHPRAYYMPCDPIPSGVSYNELMLYIDKKNKFEEDYANKTDEEYYRAHKPND